MSKEGCWVVKDIFFDKTLAGFFFFFKFAKQKCFSIENPAAVPEFQSRKYTVRSKTKSKCQRPLENFFITTGPGNFTSFLFYLTHGISIC